MILWLMLFLIIVILSFILAYLSMKDYVEVPKEKDFGIFLTRSPQNLNQALLQSLYSRLGGKIISLERLFKGQQKALVIGGPRNILEKLHQLDLLELEDYTLVDSKNISAWQMTVPTFEQLKQPLVNLSLLQKDEQFWWQLVLQPFPQNFLGRILAPKKLWMAEIKGVALSSYEGRRKELTNLLQSLNQGVVKLPQPQTASQIFERYSQRSLHTGGKLLLKDDEILKLLGKD